MKTVILLAGTGMIGIMVLAILLVFFRPTMPKNQPQKPIMIQCLTGTGTPFYVGEVKEFSMGQGKTSFIDIKRNVRITLTMDCAAVEQLCDHE